MIIYIGNLPHDVYEDELAEMFQEYGAVKSVKIIKDRYTKNSRGYAFVKMDDKDAALKAIEEWDEGSIDAQIIKVPEARFTRKSKRKKRKGNGRRRMANSTQKSSLASDSCFQSECAFAVPAIRFYMYCTD